MEKCGYGAQDDLLLYREISADGKGSCRINGMPATAGVVRDISAGLLTIHGQHDSTSLTNPATHLALLDQYAQDGAEYAAYHALYRALVTAKRALDALTSSGAASRKDIFWASTKAPPAPEARKREHRQVPNCTGSFREIGRAHV